ncbi:phage putative head morphogenesis protein, SPP1 gp7 family [Halogeometricum rufum]|uniref:Phage putative head morphogenesis protein, SPP1 gp7 family n=1 Tax=Halogeometricum rufum TaxID=553469 RepID=A0A1I6GJ02_9EURY|nr:phage minor head protein [Halogeometricum rufum]SFR42175.1 phage putative head morphogenesis protein, SPP1 gp7 family [Halogeometricum rufum]
MADPTGTRALRQDFVREIRRRFGRLRGLIRRTVGYEHDAFGLTANDSEPTERYDFPTRQEMVRQFERDLQQWINDMILERVPQGTLASGGHWTGGYVKAAYKQGWSGAAGRLRQQGVDVPDREFDELGNLPIPTRQLRELYRRAFENLRGITREMAQPLRRELTKGLAQGQNPRKIADRITKEVRTIQRTRAETLARTEVINSYSTASLDRYEDAGVETVSHGEWSTAGDSRVCPICKRLDGREFSISEMRTGTFQITADELGDDEPDSLAGAYRLQPPCHPNGRCAILPVVG